MKPGRYPDHPDGQSCSEKRERRSCTMPTRVDDESDTKKEDAEYDDGRPPHGGMEAVVDQSLGRVCRLVENLETADPGRGSEPVTPVADAED